jgi:hypothetical protein
MTIIVLTHSSNSYPSAVDIRKTTTKIIGITLTTRRITTEKSGKVPRMLAEFPR